MDKKDIKRIIIGVIIVVILLLGFYFFGSTSKEGDSQLSSNKLDDTGVMGKNIITLLLELRSLKLNETMFSSNVFKSFNDFGIEIEPQPVGRNNPFLPIGEDGTYKPDNGGTGE